MNIEFRGVRQGGTWAPVKQPVEDVIDAKCVYTWKTDEQGWIVKAKSRLVARGIDSATEEVLLRRLPPLCRLSVCVYWVRFCLKLISICVILMYTFNLTSMRMTFCDCRKVA